MTRLLETSQRLLVKIPCRWKTRCPYRVEGMALEYRVVGWRRDCRDMLGSQILSRCVSSFEHTRRDPAELLRRGNNSCKAALPPARQPLSQVWAPVGFFWLVSLSSSTAACTPAAACHGGMRSRTLALLARWFLRKVAMGRPGSAPEVPRRGRVGRSACDRGHLSGAVRRR